MVSLQVFLVLFQGFRVCRQPATLALPTAPPVLHPPITTKPMTSLIGSPSRKPHRNAHYTTTPVEPLPLSSCLRLSRSGYSLLHIRQPYRPPSRLVPRLFYPPPHRGRLGMNMGWGDMDMLILFWCHLEATPNPDLQWSSVSS